MMGAARLAVLGMTATLAGAQTVDENSLIGPAFGSMMVNFTPQADLYRSMQPTSSPQAATLRACPAIREG
jgi:hypothetical protein